MPPSSVRQRRPGAIESRRGGGPVGSVGGQVPRRVRRVRDLRARRRREHHVSGPLRDAAPRAGVGGHRVVERHADPRREGDGLRRRPLRRGATRPAAGARGDRPRAVLDDGGVAPLERAADRLQHEQGAARHRAQREPRQRRRDPPRAGAGRIDLHDLVRHRGHPPPDGPLADRQRRLRAPGGRGARPGRLLGRPPCEGPRDRVPRPAGDPAADAGEAGRGLRRRLGDVRVRPDRRRDDPRRGARRDRRPRRRRHGVRVVRDGAADRVLHLRARLLRPPRLPRLRALGGGFAARVRAPPRARVPGPGRRRRGGARTPGTSPRSVTPRRAASRSASGSSGITTSGGRSSSRSSRSATSASR